MNNQKILIVDDDDTIRNTLFEFLMKMGFEVAVAENGAMGLSVFNDAKNCDMVLADFRMPHMNGLIMAKEMKKKQPHIIVIMMSGDLSNYRKSKNVANYFIEKPFKFEDIYNLINDAFGLRDRERLPVPSDF